MVPFDFIRVFFFVCACTIGVHTIYRSIEYHVRKYSHQYSRHVQVMIFWSNQSINNPQFGMGYIVRMYLLPECCVEWAMTSVLLSFVVTQQLAQRL